MMRIRCKAINQRETDDQKEIITEVIFMPVDTEATTAAAETGVAATQPPALALAPGQIPPATINTVVVGANVEGNLVRRYRNKKLEEIPYIVGEEYDLGPAARTDT